MKRIQVPIHNLLERYLSGNSMNYRQILAVFLPLWVDQAFVTLLNMLNTAMVSSSGVAAVSAVNMVDSLNLFLLNIFIAVATGGTVIVAQYKGSGNDAMTSKSAAHAITAVTVTAALLCVLLLVFHKPVLNLLFGRAEADVLANAQIYLSASVLSYPAFAVLQSICSVLRGVGDTKSSLVLSLVTNLSYVLLNFLLVTLMGFGVAGLSVALNLARLAGAVCAVLYLLKGNHNLLISIRDMVQIEPKIMKKILTIGFPFAIEQLFFNGGKLLTQTFIVSLGTLSVTVNALCSSIASLFQFTANAVGLTSITVIGQCIGRKDIKDSKKFSKSLIIGGSLTFVAAAVVIMPLFPVLIGLYSPPAEIIPDIRRIIWIAALVQPVLWSAGFVTPNILRAAGDARFTTISSLLSMWLFRIVLGYILGIVLPFGIAGVWCAMFAEWGVRSVIFLVRLRGDRWYRHQII